MSYHFAAPFKKTGRSWKKALNSGLTGPILRGQKRVLFSLRQRREDKGLRGFANVGWIRICGAFANLGMVGIYADGVSRLR